MSEKGDAIALRDSERGEPVGAVLDLALHLAVGPVAAFEMERPALGRAQRALAEPVGETDVGRHPFLPVRCVLHTRK